MKPIIGIVPLVDTERESYWMLPGYMAGVETAGGIPLMLPLTDAPEDLSQLLPVCDGLLFTGGQDVSPELYGQQPLPQCGECIPLRDRMEQQLLALALEADKPLLGICRGIQLINAALGGTLYQDLPTQTDSVLEHHQTPPYDVPVHEVTLERESPLYGLLKKDRLAVNSYHHQGVKELAPPLKRMAAATDGLTEAVWLPGKRFVWAVQWHPEFSYRRDADSRKIFSAFVDACR